MRFCCGIHGVRLRERERERETERVTGERRREEESERVRESDDIGAVGRREGVTGGFVKRGEGRQREHGAERYHDEGTQVPVLSKIPAYPEGRFYG